MLKIEERATNYDTFRHIERVRNLLNICISDLMIKGQKHDQSKLDSPEVELFTEYTPKLSACSYDSDEYKAMKRAMKPALDHHYANNSHHPEWHEYKEIWKDVIGFENVYQISDYGRIKSCSRTIIRESQGNFEKSEKILKPNVTPKGYARIMLALNGNQVNKFIHVLVAETFLTKIINKTQVNHKNGNKLDNRVDNLEWVTPSENLQHSYDTGLRESNAKYVIKCNELDITTIGCCKMEQELRKLGYEKASASAIYSCITYDKNHTHLDLTFESYNIDEYKELNSLVNNMNLLDVLEMLCDWKAASERHNDGNIRKSIEINANRFNMSPQLVRIMENTVDLLSK